MTGIGKSEYTIKKRVPSLRIDSIPAGPEKPQKKKLVGAFDIIYIARLSAGVAQQVEQLICNQPVGGSIPSASSTMQRHAHRPSRPSALGRYPSGQRGQTVNLLAHAFGGSNPPLPTSHRNETERPRYGECAPRADAACPILSQGARGAEGHNGVRKRE